MVMVHYNTSAAVENMAFYYNIELVQMLTEK